MADQGDSLTATPLVGIKFKIFSQVVERKMPRSKGKVRTRSLVDGVPIPFPAAREDLLFSSFNPSAEDAALACPTRLISPVPGS